MTLPNISLKSYGIIILIGIVIFLLLLRQCEKPKPIPGTAASEIIYQTDSLYKDKYYELLNKPGKVVPPRIIEKWLPQKPQIIDSVAIINGYLLLHPQGKPPIPIKNEFLTNHTTSPKLLDFNLIKDTLTITLFKPDASTVTNHYPLFLDIYGYNWQKDTLGKYEVKKTKPVVVRKNRLSNFYVNVGYDGFLQVPTTGLEYNLIPGRFKLDLDGTVLIQEEPKLNLNAKLGYRLF